MTPLLKKKNLNPEIIAFATEHVNRAETEMVMDEVEKSTARQSYNNIPKTYSYGDWEICLSS